MFEKIDREAAPPARQDFFRIHYVSSYFTCGCVPLHNSCWYTWHFKKTPKLRNAPCPTWGSSDKAFDESNDVDKPVQIQSESLMSNSPIEAPRTACTNIETCKESSRLSRSIWIEKNDLQLKYSVCSDLYMALCLFSVIQNRSLTFQRCSFTSPDFYGEKSKLGSIRLRLQLFNWVAVCQSPVSVNYSTCQNYAAYVSLNHSTWYINLWIRQIVGGTDAFNSVYFLDIWAAQSHHPKF